MGLLFTWEEHAGGARFKSALWSELNALVRRLFRRRRPQTVHVGTVMGTAGVGRVVAHATRPLPEGASVEEKIDLLKQQLDEVSLTAAAASAAAEAVDSRLTSTEHRLTEQIRKTKTDMTDRIREHTPWTGFHSLSSVRASPP